MSGFFGARSNIPNRLGSIQVQTSEYGTVIPYAAGTVKVPVKLLDYVDFNSTAQSSGGKGGGGAQSYIYSASVDLAIAYGPWAGPGNIYSGTGAASLVGGVENFTIGAGSTSHQVNSGGTAFWYDEGVSFQVAYSVPANDYGSDGAVTLAGTHPVALQKVASGPLAGQYTCDAYGIYGFSAADAGKTATITYAYTLNPTHDSTSNQNAPAQYYRFTSFPGTRTQAPWGYMTSRHPERALAYAGIARLVSQNLNLGTSATPPNFGIEGLNFRGLALGGGVGDCDPAAVIADICADPVAGMAWPWLGDVTQYSNFCVANGLVISPFYDSARKATEVIGELCDITNSAPVWSGSALKIVPYGDRTAAGNGRVYTPQTVPIYDLDYTDFLVKKAGEEPVEPSRSGLADNYNDVTLEYTNREDNYNTAILHERDEASVLQLGKRLPIQTISAHQFCDKNAATMAMNMLLARNSKALRTYKFTLPWYYFLLEPMDVLTINPQIGSAVKIPVRIVSIEEQEDYSLTVEAEDFVFGAGSGTLYPKGDSAGTGAGGEDIPGDATLLSAITPTTRITATGSPEIWLALTGGPRWGGCGVWFSLDDTNYVKIGVQQGTARAGTLTAALAAHADPDTASTLAVSVAGTLGSGTQAAADALALMCQVGSELMSYETASLTGAVGGLNQYGLTYLRRGVFSSGVQAHGVGEIFTRLDDSIFKYSYDPTLAGKLAYFKFTSFNLYGLREEDLSLAPAHPVILGGALAASGMQLTAALNSGGADCKINIFAVGGAVGSSGTTSLPNGAVLALPAATLTPEACATLFYVNFNPSGSGYVVYADYSAWLAAQASGFIGIGNVTTPAAAGAASAYPSAYDDIGENITATPEDVLTGGTADVVAFNDTDARTGICFWTFAGTTASPKVLNIVYSIDASYDTDVSLHSSQSAVITCSYVDAGGTSHSTVVVSRGGSAFSISGSGMVSVPAGSSGISVKAQAVTHSLGSTCDITIGPITLT